MSPFPNKAVGPDEIENPQNGFIVFFVFKYVIMSGLMNQIQVNQHQNNSQKLRELTIVS